MTKQYVVVYNNDSKCIVEIPDGAVFTLGPGIPGSKGPWMFRVYADPKRKQCIYACGATAFRRTDVLVMSPKDLHEQFEARKEVARVQEMMAVVETTAKEISNGREVNTYAKGKHVTVTEYDDAALITGCTEAKF